MKPLKLTMAAFGPYAGEQTIDFTVLNGRNIFLITGPTGAGKTTIFDGISYAIFGKGSGRDRDGENLRSDFASDTLLTAVELTFELRGRHYRVKRIPKQQKKKARGEGYTEQAADAELVLLDEPEALPICSVTAVNQKIGQIMAITYEQFKQIMMISQGEFRELITADSKAREAILQKIFGTQSFYLIQEKMNMLAKALQEEQSTLRLKRDEHIRRLSCDSNAVLQGLIQEKDIHVAAVLGELLQLLIVDEQHEQELAARIEKLEAGEDGQQKKIAAALENNRKLAARQELEKQKALLENQQLEMAGRREVLHQARRAALLRGLEENCIARQSNMIHRGKILEEAETQMTQAAAAVQRSAATLALENSREDERRQLQEEQTVLKGYIDKVRLLEEKQRSCQLLDQQAARQAAALEAAKDRQEQLKAAIKALQVKVDGAKEAAAQFAVQNAEWDKARQTLIKWSALQQEHHKLIGIRQIYASQASEFTASQNAYQAAKGEYERLQRLFYQGQAGLLAQGLQAAHPCPVCGSTHHPAPAALLDGMPGEEQLKKAELQVVQAQQKVDASKERFDKVKAEGWAQKDIVQRLQNELKAVTGCPVDQLPKEEVGGVVSRQVSELEQSVRRLAERCTLLASERQQEATWAQRLTAEQNRLQTAEKEQEQAQTTYTAVFAQARSEREVLASLAHELPPEVMSVTALEQRIEQVGQRYLQLTETLKKAEQDHQQNQLRYEKAQTGRELAQQALQEARQEYEAVQQKMAAELQQAGFSNEREYEQAKLAEQDMLALEKTINQYYETLRSVSDSFCRVLQETAGLEVADIAALETVSRELKEQKAVLHQQKTIVYSRLSSNRQTLHSINSLQAKLEAKEKEYSVIGELANVARGFNSEKITFERYVLAAFFDDIIAAANVRLAKMTARRYEMNRVCERGKGNAQSGLELEVFDNYTGRTRHIKTLSGGEGFKASLALALGLADVVQSYTGGISLETMFIDEGFGTLDPESLDNAIECLVELQHAGRLVGIISHVPELKEKIEAKLEIEAGRSGSTARFCL